MLEIYFLYLMQYLVPVLMGVISGYIVKRVGGNYHWKLLGSMIVGSLIGFPIGWLLFPVSISEMIFNGIVTIMIMVVIVILMNPNRV